MEERRLISITILILGKLTPSSWPVLTITFQPPWPRPRPTSAAQTPCPGVPTLWRLWRTTKISDSPHQKMSWTRCARELLDDNSLIEVLPGAFKNYSFQKQSKFLQKSFTLWLCCWVEPGHMFPCYTLHYARVFQVNLLHNSCKCSHSAHSSGPPFSSLMDDTDWEMLDNRCSAGNWWTDSAASMTSPVRVLMMTTERILTPCTPALHKL